MKNLEIRRIRRSPVASLAALCLFVSSAAGLHAAEDGLSASAAQQIQSLLAEKELRTPAQMKLDSHLIYAIRMHRGEAVAPGVPTQRLYFTWDANGRVLVDIDAPISSGLLAQIRQDGEVIISVREYESIRAKVPLSRLETLASLPAVRWIRPAPPVKTHRGRLTSEGDAAHRAGLARTNFAVMGEGVKVGVLSDSVDSLRSLQNSMASGELPTVTVLPGQAGVGQDEGTAMLEIIADLAPKADLFYATAINGPASFAQNIISLRNQGCDIIVDDVGYASEAPFQDGVVAQAVNAVTASGGLYFSSAGNSGNKNDGTSCTWEGDFADGGAVTVGTAAGRAHTFGGTILNRITLEPFVFSDFVSFWWSDPMNRATNDYDLFILDAAGNNVVSSSTNPQTGFQDPWESADGQDANQVVLLKVRGASRFLNLELFRGSGTLAVSTEGNTHGHSCAADAFGVAAVNASAVAPNAFSSFNMVENFSSDGPRRMFYDAGGTPYTPSNFLASGGIVRRKPDIAAADGVTTSVSTRGGPFNPFFGTSAAAPHAAAIAALIKSYNRALTPDQIRFALTNTALDIEGPGQDRDSGVGIVMPGPALSTLPPPLPTLVASNLYGGNGNGVIDPNECNELDLVLRNNAVSVATAVSATLVTTTPGVFVIVGTSSYPSIQPGTTSVNLIPFRLYTAPTFVCGTPVDLSLRISSSLGGFTNNFRLASGVIGIPPTSVTGAIVTPIPDNDTNGVDIPLPISGFLGSIGKITADVHILHESDIDLTLQLIAPDGTLVVLSRRRGGIDMNYGQSCSVPTTFDSMAATNIAAGFAPFIGRFRPQQSLTAFNGKSGAAVNGTWKLRVIDDLASLTGSVQCATITISPAFCTDGGGDCSADVGVTMTDAPDPILVGSNLTYTIAVTNRSPHLAPVTTLLDVLPPGVTVVGLSSSVGFCSASAGSVNCNLGTLSGNGGASVTIIVRTLAAGVITNRVSVNSVATELNVFDNTAVAVTTVQNPMPIIVPFATALVFESGPVNGGVDPGETLTINFYLRNIGTLDTTNLVAQLLATGGVLNPSAHQTYGRLVAGGLAVANAFSFTASATNGNLVTATFQLQQGTNDLGTVSFTFAVGGAITLANSSVIRIPDSGATNPYPSTIPVSGFAGVVSKLTVTISNLTHTFPEDIDALLVSPSGQKVMLMSDAGASVDVFGAVLKFDDAGAPLPLAGPIVTGTYRPTDFEPGDIMPAPAPPGPYATNLSAFNGFSPNGTWSLFIADDFAGDQGRVTNGWSLSITTSDPINPQAELAISVSDAPDPVMLGSNVTYTIRVTNAGPEVALAVLVTNTLPPGMLFVSSAGAGVCSNDSGLVVCDLGILNASNAAVITLVATATGLGSQTFTAQVSGGVAEFNLADNTASVTTAIIANADLAISIVASPSTASVNGSITYTLTITNRGPNNASGVTITNTLPAGVTFVAAGASQGGCSESGGVVSCSLGAIASLGQASAIIIVTTPAGVAPLTDTALVAATSPTDLNLANNQVTIVTDNINPLFIIVPAMAFLTDESGPVDGGIEVGENVSITFELRNIGSLPTSGLVATLLPTGGVTSPSAPRTYGVLNPNGAAAGASFNFTAGGIPGDLLTATLQLQDGPYDLGTVSFTFALGNTARFAVPGSITIPEFGKASPYPSSINVSGLTGTISKVTITLSNLSHVYPDDINVLLTGPTNQTVTAVQSVMLMSDAGGGNAASGVTLIFDDAAASSLPDSTALSNGTFKPTDYDATEVLEAPAPPRPYAPALDAFNGIDPNGVWRLFVFDDFYQDGGRIADGWTLEITTVGIINPPAALLAAGRFSPAGQFEFMLKGQAGGKYLIQRSPDMRNWSTIGNATLAPSNTLMFTDPAPAGNSPRFYRAIHIP
ncbi:MAG: hypothetical protein QOF48_3163 [Verrucomicrobiota bacterium]